MGDVVAIFKVVIDKEADKEKIKEEIKKIVEKKEGYLNEIKETPFVFGLIALDSTVIIDENKPHLLDEIEEELKKIEGVNSVEISHLDRL